MIRRVLYGLLAVFLGLYVWKVADLYLHQSSHIFYPETRWLFTPKDMGLQFEEVSFTAPDGVKLSGWFVPANPERGVVLYFHGNHGNISYERVPIRTFHDLGYSVFLFDYRGYGKSEGEVSEAGMKWDADAAWDYLTKTRGIPPEKIILCGRSLGAAVAVPLAARSTPRALLVEGAFTSLGDMAAELYPYFPARFLLRYRYDVLSEIPNVRCPLLVVHSHDDELIPVRQAKKLFQAAHEPKHFLELTGHHNSDEDPAAQAIYRKGLSEFLERF